jgi:energy-coupling factor transporter ATP-binding protein EcfA2
MRDSTVKQTRGLRTTFFRWFGVNAEPILDWPFSRAEIARFHGSQSRSTNTIDDQTWRDLELDAYSDGITQEASIFAKQVLHHRLHAELGDTAATQKAARLRVLLDDAPYREELTDALRPLREVDTEISELLFIRKFTPIPAWSRYLWAGPLALAAAIGGIYLSIYALLVIGCVIVAITTLQNRLEPAMASWAREEKSLRKLLQVTMRLAALKSATNHRLTNDFAGLGKKANSLTRAITRLPALVFVPGATEYADWYLLKNIRHYFHCLTVIERERVFLQQCFELVADLEADIAVANEIASAPHFCWAARSNAQYVHFASFVHPTLPGAQPLSIMLDNKGALVTGQNGVGKSTFLKAMGINLIVGRTYGFCYATDATISTLPVYASLNNPDSLSNGESSYIAELRRARELLQANENGAGSICLIDEIFRGTNHLESVSASAAVLHALTQNALVIASTHHIVLAPILTQCLIPVAIENIAREDGRPGRLRIANGVLRQTNGIALLDTHGLGSDVSASARRVEAWLREYLAHPTMVPNLFAA